MKYQWDKTGDAKINYYWSGFTNFRIEKWEMENGGTTNVFHSLRIWKFRFMFSFISNKG